MFTTLIVQPLFNLLTLIYALIPGHNFGIAIILFTIVVRMLMWPLIKKQLHQTKLMRQIQPELKKIKQDAAGNRQKEQMMMLALYKERGINPFGQIGIMLVQLPIFIGLYMGLQKILADSHALVNFSYDFIRNLGWMKQLAANIHLFDASFVGLVDLTRPAMGPKGLYIPALIIVVGSAVAQYYQSKQLMPTGGERKRVRDILKDAKDGKEADQGDLNAAMSRNMQILLPGMVLFFTIGLPAALSLYWLVSSLVAYAQQSIILREDTAEMENNTEKTAAVRVREAREAEIVSTPLQKSKNKTKKKSGSKKRRRG